jgi:hypothetical protein
MILLGSSHSSVLLLLFPTRPSLIPCSVFHIITVSQVTNMGWMFYNAEAFDQNLCTWGPLLNAALEAGDVENMFYGATSCVSEEDPDLSSSPPGPLCHSCTD